MRFRAILGLILVVMVVVAGASQFSANARTGGSTQKSDPISGDWDVTFKVGNSVTPATFTFLLDGDKVTGTAFSAHTGPGTIRDGSWIEGKLNFTLDFKAHESIAISGNLQDGKLAGEFRTEGFVSTWEATKKK